MAIAVDSTSASSGVAAATSVTFAHTVAAASEVIVVSVGARVAQPSTNNTVSTLTYNAAALTSQKTNTNNATSPDTFSGRTEIWTKVDPSTGANNVVVTWTGSVTYGAAGASSWTGVDQVTPIDATGGTTGTSTTLSGSITTVAADAYIIDAVYSRSGTLTKNAAQTLIAGVTISSDDNVGASYKAAGAAGAKTMDWTESADGNDWAMSIISLNPSTAVAAVKKLAALGVG